MGRPLNRQTNRELLDRLAEQVVRCTRCPRLSAYVRGFRGTPGYHGAPVPSFGDATAALTVLGLAPGAHGANRTGRPFTGDAAGTFLYRALHEVGMASRPESVSRDDGLLLQGVWITNAVRCAPPENRPSAQEIANCSPLLTAELALLPRTRVVLALGRIAHDAYLRWARAQGAVGRLADHGFAHGAVHSLDGVPTLIDSFHCSRYNVNVGKLTWPMFLAVVRQAADLSRQA